MKPRNATRWNARAAGVRSGLEDKVKQQLEALGIEPSYEELTISYVKPARQSRYTADFVLPNGIIVETKGMFTSEDRQKHKVIKAQHPELDIRFVFSRSATRLNKKSETTYALWAETYGFRWADRLIPMEWIKEPPTPERMAAIVKARAR
ncbi:MAG: endodeoxyribonuclease [Armatimonadetes bacterium]|nr:endodeoxyribonuclease [Armatimonadota bacterium]MCA1995700.1 endodeoxyribonuclease [Armatimonadota bacterium]